MGPVWGAARVGIEGCDNIRATEGGIFRSYRLVAHAWFSDWEADRYEYASSNIKDVMYSRLGRYFNKVEWDVYLCFTNWAVGWGSVSTGNLMAPSANSSLTFAPKAESRPCAILALS
jgi:hypothetical protein